MLNLIAAMCSLKTSSRLLFCCIDRENEITISQVLSSPRNAYLNSFDNGLKVGLEGSICSSEGVLLA